MLFDTLKTIDTSVDNMSTLDETFDQKDILEKYNNKATNLIEKGKNIQPHLDMKRENLEKEVEEIYNK